MLYTIQNLTKMVFYEIYFQSLPEIVFALSDCEMYSNENKNIIDHRSTMIELYYNENHTNYISTEYDAYEVPGNSIAVFMPDQRYEITFGNEEKIEHVASSVGVKISDLKYRRYDMPSEDIPEMMLSADKKCLYIPQQMPLNEKDRMRYQALFKETMNHAALCDDYAEQMRAISVWFELITLVHTSFKKMIFAYKSNYSIGTYHIIKAKKYIDDHYCEAISEKHVAKRLGISTVYLSSLFRKETGSTVTDYINRLRMERVCVLLLDKKLSFDEICNSVGFGDKRYVQKLFKRYYGMGMSKFQKLGNGLSYQVDNPYFVENLDHDVTKVSLDLDKTN